MSNGLHRGPKTYRYKLNPKERDFADKWEDWNESARVLDWISGDGEEPRVATEGECALAATVIQWFGSHVGQSFLREVGFEMTEEAMASERDRIDRALEDVG